MKKISVIIVAGGSGRRMGINTPKQFLTLEEETHTSTDVTLKGYIPPPENIRNATLAGDALISEGTQISRAENIGPESLQMPDGAKPTANDAIPGGKYEGGDKSARESYETDPAIETILEITLRQFLTALPGCEIVVVLPSGEIARWEHICTLRGLEGTHMICAGGNTRFDSVRNGIRCVGPCDYIAVHDGVRPLVTSKLIQRCIRTAEIYGTAVPAVRPVDSFRIVTDRKSCIIDRDVLRAIQTPQVFRADILRKAYDAQYDPAFTDDASVVEASGMAVTLCEGERENIKITTPEDLAVARALRYEQLRRTERQSANTL